MNKLKLLKMLMENENPKGLGRQIDECGNTNNNCYIKGYNDGFGASMKRVRGLIDILEEEE